MLGFDFYEAWTGVAQPLTKFDLVAVPGKTGAMENWGLLLFDERRFLFNRVCTCSATLFRMLYLPYQTHLDQAWRGRHWQRVVVESGWLCHRILKAPGTSG